MSVKYGPRNPRNSDTAGGEHERSTASEPGEASGHDVAKWKDSALFEAVRVEDKGLSIRGSGSGLGPRAAEEPLQGTLQHSGRIQQGQEEFQTRYIQNVNFL